MHSFNSCLIHCVWSTKNRAAVLTCDLRERLWPYLGGIARENGMKALAVGGARDHVHILISLPGTLSVARALQLLKATPQNGFTKRFQTWPSLVGKGYGAFSVGVSGVEATLRYIRNQAEHHRKYTFREELGTMLRKHGLAYDERMLN